MDILDEIDQTEFELVRKIHNGHENGTASDEDDCSSDASSDIYKPPLFTYEELKANLVDASDFAVTEIDMEYKKILPSKSDLIAKELIDYISPTYCYICNKEGAIHYKISTKHRTNVDNWIKQKCYGKRLDRSIYCVCCNLVLTDRLMEQQHYSCDDHYENNTRYCHTCNRLLANLDAHMKTKGHIRKTEKLNGIDGGKRKKKDEIDQFDNPVFRRIRTKETDSKKLTNLELAQELESLMTDYCSICQKSGRPNKSEKSHYIGGPHRRNVLAWLEMHASKDDIPKIYCVCCNLPLTKASLGEAHYTTRKHLELNERYCATCKRLIMRMDMAEHVMRRVHKKKAAEYYLPQKTDQSSTMETASSVSETDIDQEPENKEEKADAKLRLFLEVKKLISLSQSVPVNEALNELRRLNKIIGIIQRDPMEASDDLW